MCDTASKRTIDGEQYRRQRDVSVQEEQNFWKSETSWPNKADLGKGEKDVTSHAASEKIPISIDVLLRPVTRSNRKPEVSA